jgi:hypothetical protein
MERLMVMLGMILAVLTVVVVPALAQDVPEVPLAPPSEGPGDGLVTEEGPGAPVDVSPPDPPLSDSPPSDVPPSDAPLPGTLPPPSTPPSDTSPPDTPSLDVPPSNTSLMDAPTSYVSPPDIGEQKTAEGDSVDEGIKEQKAGSELDEESDVPEADSSQAEEAEEQEIEDREIETAGVEKARVGKDEDDEDEDDEDEKAGDPKQETEQDADSGDVDQSVDVINTGDNVNMCLGVLQTANTGNAQNAGGVVQDDSEADEIELDDGSSVTITPQLIVDCRQIINQIVTVQTITGDNNASGRGARKLPEPGQLDLGTNKAALKTVGTSNLGLSKAAAPRTLPRTGGGALLGLGAGVLLISGGLVIRRIFR